MAVISRGDFAKHLQSLREMERDVTRYRAGLTNGTPEAKLAGVTLNGIQKARGGMERSLAITDRASVVEQIAALQARLASLDTILLPVPE